MEVKNLKAYLANVGMTLRDFADQIEYDPRYLSKVVYDKRPCGRKLAKSIYEATSGIIKLECKPKKDRNKNQEEEQKQKIG